MKVKFEVPTSKTVTYEPDLRYLAIPSAGGPPLAAFTVGHNAIAYVKGYLAYGAKVVDAHTGETLFVLTKPQAVKTKSHFY